jgi:hypothetical protein
LITISPRDSRNWRGNSEINVFVDNVGQGTRFYGVFAMGDMMRECLDFFENCTSKLTIEFVDTHVMQIQKDIRKSWLQNY